MNPPAKRPKVLRQSQLVASDHTTAPTTDAAEAEESDILWGHRSFFALDRYQEVDVQQYLPDGWDTTSAGAPGTSKRALEPVSSDQGDGDLYGGEEATTEAQVWLAQAMPELYPSIPSKEGQSFSLSLSNPFAANGSNRHPRLKGTAFLPEDGAVNGYIKFRLRMSDVEDHRSPVLGKGKGITFLGNSQLRHRTQLSPQHMQQNSGAPPNDIQYLPPNFGRRLKLDDTDNKLLKFYLVAYCQGRTLLTKTNFWMSSIAAMAVEEECVKHALLALAGAYVLDYLPSPQLLARTNNHYQQAVGLINEALRTTGMRATERGDSIVSALSLLIVDDCINWELRGEGPALPNWYLGGQLAKSLLDESDPGYRYWKRVNVQCSDARLANANFGAFACIVAQPVTALDMNGPDQTFDWLLAGSHRDSQKIHGSTGLCPKLLHTFAQVTHLTIRMARNPESVVIPHGAKKIQERLDSIHQWSELSQGYLSKDTLLESCQLDANGKVTSAAMVTDLTGEIWIATVRMYLHCRFYRRPRDHALVQQNLQTFLECLTRMPYSGPLFTSQAPFCCIFLMALVSYREEDRKIIRDWFETIVSNVGCRSSVPPVWVAVKHMWTWMDMAFADGYFEEASLIGERNPWWEVMIAHLVETEGYISLI